MEILLWLAPAAVATLVAMAIAGWVGRERAVEPPAATERLPGEVVGQPGEGVSAARPARVSADPVREPARDPVPDAARDPVPDSVRVEREERPDVRRTA